MGRAASMSGSIQRCGRNGDLLRGMRMSTWATRVAATTTLMVIFQSSTAAMLITKARKAMGVDNDLFTTGEEQAVFKQGYINGKFPACRYH